MKSDIQSRGQNQNASSSFPMANKIDDVRKFLDAHPPEKHAPSLTEALRQRLGPKNEAALENLYEKVSETIQSGVDYVNENPDDSKFVAAVGELAGWVKKQAQPGLEAVEDKAKEYLPKVEAWIAEVLAKRDSH